MADLATKIAQLNALRSTFGDAWVDARIAELREATPAAQLGITTGDESSIVAPLQVSAGGDVRDNVVLRDITIAEGGRLIVGSPPADLPPQPAEVRKALAAYLRTLLERYQFLSLQGLGASGSQQVRIGLRAVFINLRTNVAIGEAAALFGADVEAGGQVRRGGRAASQRLQISTDLRQWLAELLSPDEQAALLGTSAPASDVDLDPVRQRLLAPRTALELVRHHRALILLGDPGSGKTTVLRHLALGFAHARLNAGQTGEAAVEPELVWPGALPLPILVQLRRFATDLAAPPHDAGPLLDHIERVLSGDRLRPLARHLQDRLEAGSVLLLLDGLDEVADDTRRAWVARAVALFQSRFSQSRIVLTSRIYAYREPCLLPPPFQVATLQPLDDRARDDFIARWYHAALLQGSELAGEEQAQAAQIKARDLIDALARRPRLREIAANPLLLTMIALVHQHRLRLPQQRARLYEECLLLLLEQWERRRAEGGPAGLAAALGVPDQTDRLALIQPLAYELQVRGREEAGNREARTWLLERFLDLAQGDGARAKALIETFLDFLEGRSGLLIARDIKDRYAFPHKTFQEYLAARELVYQGSKKTQAEVIAQRHAATWREVILLVAGHLVAGGLPQEAKLLGWRLLEADADGGAAFYRSAVLAGELVEELGGALGRDGQSLKEQVVRALVALVQGGHLSAQERVEAAFLLGRLGDPRLPTPDQPGYWCAIEVGPFWYGDEGEGEPLQEVTLPYAFKIARYAITNAEYRRFMDDDGYNFERRWWTPESWKWLQRKRRTAPYLWEDSRYNNPTQPVVGVTWYEAAAYCNWLTDQGHAHGWLPADAEIRLPTSLEWERAARHTDQRHYPWGDDPPNGERTNYKDTGIGQPAPVGCFPNGAAICGALDMVGNMMEWMATPYEAPETLESQKDFTPEQGVLIASNDFRDQKERLCCGDRGRLGPYIRGGGSGFRIVWSLALIV